MSQQRPRLAYLVLIGGVIMTASASIMIRTAQRLGASSPMIAAGRLGLAALILLPIVLWRAGPELRRLRWRDLLLGIGSGGLLAIHFSAWVLSLEYTSVASSSALVATNPLWIALATLLLFRERLATQTWLGVLITIGGSAIIGISDSGGASGGNALFGDGLALLAALAGSGYFLLGRALQRRLSTLAYIWVVYTSAAVILIIVAVMAGVIQPGEQPASYPLLVYLLLLGLAVGPQLLGHTALNWSLRHLSTTFVGVATLGEPIGAALLALVLFNQGFTKLQLLGFVLLLVGIGAAALGERGANVAADAQVDATVDVSAGEVPLTR